MKHHCYHCNLDDTSEILVWNQDKLAVHPSCEMEKDPAIKHPLNDTKAYFACAYPNSATIVSSNRLEKYTTELLIETGVWTKII